MIDNLREWVTYCVTISPKLWCTMMRRASFFRKHLITDPDWQPRIDPYDKTANHALTWAKMSLHDVDRYNMLIGKIQEGREKFHYGKNSDRKAERREYMKDYMRKYRRDQALDKAMGNNQANGMA